MNNLYLRVLKSLVDAGVRPLIAGGVAASLYGSERVTFDLDLIIALEKDVLSRALQCLIAEGFVLRLPVTLEQASDPQQLREWAANRNLIELTLVNPDTGLEVGFLIPPAESFPEYADRAEAYQLGTVGVEVVSLPDLIAMKRRAGRPKDIEDVAVLERFLRQG